MVLRSYASTAERQRECQLLNETLLQQLWARLMLIYSLKVKLIFFCPRLTSQSDTQGSCSRRFSSKVFLRSDQDGSVFRWPCFHKKGINLPPNSLSGT